MKNSKEKESEQLQTVLDNSVETGIPSETMNIVVLTAIFELLLDIKYILIDIEGK